MSTVDIALVCDTIINEEITQLLCLLFSFNRTFNLGCKRLEVKSNL